MKHHSLHTFWLLCLVRLSAQVPAGTRFLSHVSVNTPARSFTHGVGDPLPASRYQRPEFNSFRHPSTHSRISTGHSRVKPSIPFDSEDVPRETSPWQHNRNNYNHQAVSIPLLAPSPYKVDSPDPESLWPEGLFLPPLPPPRFDSFGRRSDHELDPHDPFLLEGSEAIAAVAASREHGPLYFHEIPHIESLLRNQEERLRNHLEVHTLGSLRYTWTFFRL